ncbi:MAG: FKBP-type peptidyl-prolyl cis-trans isomerase [Microbacterium sp.]
MRKVRLIPAALAVLGLTAVGLVGCSQQPSASCDQPVADAAVSDLVTVTGDVGDQPQIDLYTPFRVEDTAIADVSAGEGTPITSDTQVVGLDVTLVSGDSGDTIVEGGFDGQLSQLSTILPGLTEALECATPGSRTVVALAPSGIVPEYAESIQLADTDSAVAVVDVRTVYLAAADGADVFNSGFGMPTVVRAVDGRPGVVVPDSAPPSEVTVQTIKRGTGEVVTGDAPVRVHYLGVVWDTKEEFDSSWDGEPASLTLQGVVPGFAQALDGQTVGSQVLVVVPPDAGYGDQEQGAIPANSTLVFVIDILGIDPLPTQ